MADVGLRQLSMILLSLSMVLTSYLGITGVLGPTPGIGAALLAVALLLAFDLGRRSVALW